MGYFSSVLAEPAAQAASSSALADQLRAQNPAINWNIQGIDRAQELADWLSSRGVKDISTPKLTWEDYTKPGEFIDMGMSEAGEVYQQLREPTTEKRGYLDFGGVRLGNEGNIHTKNGLLGYIPDNGSKNNNQAFASSTKGHGAVSYQYVQGPDGRVQIIPKWTSTSDMGAVRDVLKGGLLLAGGLGLAGMGPLSGLGEALGTAAGSSSAAAGGFSAGAVDSAALGLDMAAGAASAGGGTVGGGLTLGGSAGYGSIAAPSAALGAGGAGLSSGIGLTAPAFTGGGAGIVGSLGMTAGAGAGTAAADAGGITSLLRGLGSASGIRDLASIASGIYGMSLVGKARDAADPFAQYRPAYGAQLAALEANPGSIVSRPGFQAGLETIQRKSAASGYYGSGNMASALGRYSGDFYNQEATRLASLAGAGQTPGAGQALGADLASRSLGSIGYGLAPMLARFIRGG